MVYAPDKTDEGALARRLSVRPKHLETAATNISSGYIRALSGICHVCDAATYLH